MSTNGPETSAGAKPRDRRIFERTRDAIEEAAATGFFSNLPGSGRPLDFSFEDNPFIPSGMLASYRLLRNAGFALPWIEDRKEIDRRRSDLDQQLAAQVNWIRSYLTRLARMPAYLRPSRWARLNASHQDFLARFGRSIDSLNRKIDIYNLKAPVMTLQVPRYDRERAIRHLSDVMPASLEDATGGRGP
jgi:hypothetical protein